MNDRQNAKLSMAQRVADTFEKYEPEYSTIAPMVATVAALKENVGSIREALKEQQAVSVTASTQEKRAAEARMILPCVKLANVLYVIGFSADNKELINLQGLSERSFYNLEGNAKPALAKRLLELARLHEGELSAYGVTPEELTTTEQAVADFTAMLAKPHEAIGARKQKTTNLAQLFATLDSTLYDRLDKLMVLFKQSQPAFYGEYRTARNIL
jgi:hypothetical protein